MNTISILANRKTTSNIPEVYYIQDNKISSIRINIPQRIGDFNKEECSIELRAVLPDGDYISYEIPTDSKSYDWRPTIDITEKSQLVNLVFVVTSNGGIVGRTKPVQLNIKVNPDKGEELTPREQFDIVINEQRETIAEQGQTITEQSAQIEQDTQTISGLNSQVGELQTQNAEQAQTITRQNTTIDELNERRTPVYIPAQLEPKLITPKDTTEYYSPSEGKDGFSAVTVEGATVEALGLNENYYKLNEPFLDKVGKYNPFPENSYGGIYFTELNENDFPVGIKVVNYDYNYNNFSAPVLNTNTLKNNIKSFILLDCKNVRIADNYFDGAQHLMVCRLDGVLSIGGSAFKSCTSLTELTLPNSLTSIGGSAFYNCTSLTELTLPDSLTSIGGYAFQSCTSLTGLTLPNSLTSIGGSAFYNCTSLTELTLPDSLTSISQYAFSGCTSLTELTLPNSLTSIGGSAFQSCTSLTELTLPDSLTSISQYAFSGCTSLTELTLPDSLTSIGGYAFQSCTSLTELTLPDSLTSIGVYAFSGCTSLTELTLPDSLTSIGTNAFLSCTSLTELTLPDSLTSIGASAFQSCTSLTELTLAQGFNCNGLNVSASTRFTAETIVACLEALADRTGQTAYTITFGTTNINKLTAEQRAIATNKNWNLA